MLFKRFIFIYFYLKVYWAFTLYLCFSAWPKWFWLWTTWKLFPWRYWTAFIIMHQTSILVTEAETDVKGLRDSYLQIHFYFFLRLSLFVFPSSSIRSLLLCVGWFLWMWFLGHDFLCFLQLALLPWSNEWYLLIVIFPFLSLPSIQLGGRGSLWIYF